MSEERPEGAPELPASSLEIRVRFCETDLMGIVHHANYLKYFEAGRVDYFHKRGVSYEAWIARGIHMPVVETRLRYRKAARFDDVIVVRSTLAELRRATVRFTFRVERGEALLCEGETLLACVGNDLVPRRIPDDLAGILRGAEVVAER